MTLHIPAHLAEAVEAAARAQFDRHQAGRLDAGRFRDDGELWAWADLTEHDHVTYRALVLPAVQAAAEVWGVTE